MGTTTAQTAYLAELETKRRKWEPENAGWKNFARLDVTEGDVQAQPLIQARIVLYDEMLKRLRAVEAAIQALDDYGYPEIPDVDAPADILRLLNRENREIDAALATVHPLTEAVSGVTTIGSGVPA
jgi:hypothetical protein